MKKNLILLFLIGAVYFAVFLVPNNLGAQDEAMLLATGQDEPVIYPILVHMLTPARSIGETWWRLVIYGDYHYGYPFYLASFLVLLPVRLVYGAGFIEHTQLNLLLLRQLISVLPMILSAGLLTYMQTRLRSTLRSVLLFVLLLLIPGVVRSAIRWWHPDGLAVLAVTLTLFSLQRDHLRFGRWFWFAAVFCGLATAIKLLGVYFFAAIPAYLLAGLLQKRLGWARLVLLGAGFSLVMAATFVISNPFLFYPSQRAKFLRIQAEKQVELDKGYTHDDPALYQKGPAFWEHTLTRWYGPPWLLLYLSVALAASCFFSSEPLLNRLILAWCLPLSLYLVYFVAPKPDHYWLPVMLPLFSASANLLAADSLRRRFQHRQGLSLFISAAVLAIVIYMLLTFAWQDVKLIVSSLSL